MPILTPIHRFEFEAHPITAIEYDGRPAFIAREVGVALGYSHQGKRLPNKITGEWADEFIEGHDFRVATHQELQAIDGLFPEGTDSVPRRGMLLLFESGLHLALAKTNKPIGKALRRWLADEVLPAVASSGTYTAPQPHTTDNRPDPMAVAREQRLARKQQLDEARFLRQTLQVLDKQGLVTPEVRASYEVVAAEIATGRVLGDLKPVADDNYAHPPASIGEEYSMHPSQVGRVISRLGIRGDPKYSRKIVNKARGHDRTVTSYTYNRAGYDLITGAIAIARRQAGRPPRPRLVTEPEGA